MSILRLSSSPAHLTVPARPDVLSDVAGLGVLMVMIGVAAMAGWAALPIDDGSAVEARSVGLAVLLVAAGLGLLHRRDWARCATIGLFSCAILAQLNHRWLESEALHLFAHGLRGVHQTTIVLSAQSSGALPVGDPASAGLALAVCFALGWFVMRLQSSAVRTGFK